MKLAGIPLALYIHLPWCVRKCPYCDFNSHVAPLLIPENEYIDRLIADFKQQLPIIWGRRLVSIFFGGGTPSLFSPASIDRLLLELNALLPFHADMEITLEANPGTIDEAKFKGFRSAGVNRLSIGIQSLQDEKLKILGRIHDRVHALRAIETAQQAGFENFNLDLMHGLPNQTVDDAMADLHDALAFKPKHLSWYQLTIEPNTVFHHHTPLLPEEDVLADIQDEGKRLLAENKLLAYEVSAYAQSNFTCQHNINYWQFGDYLGIGAGAHSKITHYDSQTISRHWQHKNPRDYLNPAKNFTAERKILTRAEIIFEFMLNALRLNAPISFELFTERTGLNREDITPQLSLARDKKLMTFDQKNFSLTPLGQQFLNDVVGMFL